MACIFLFFTGMYAGAQIDVKGKIKDKALERADRHVDEAIDNAFDAAEEGVEKAVKGDNEETAEEAGEDQDAEKSTVEKEEKAQAPVQQTAPSLATYSKYDFIPGEKVILFEDFSQDAVGEFPALWNTNSSGEVMTTNIYPGKWFKPMGDGVFQLEKSIPFPDNYTVEFDVIPMYKEEAGDCDFTITIFDQSENELNAEIIPGNAGFHLGFSAYEHRFMSYTSEDTKLEANSESGPLVPEKLNKVRIWVQKQRIRVYMEEKKVFDLPRGVEPGYHYNRFRISLWSAGGEPLISNIRIAAGLPDMRSKLLTEGRLVTYGIYFDSGKDLVKPESYATIKEIATILQENPSVRVRIIGHTDSDGNDAANLDLSKRRAASVKNVLGKEFGIDASRIETDGKGESEPVAPNTTSEGKAANRRVEFIKL
jgi:outer membrane protein OmpA-like peptidoglycan-associated protein